MCSGLNIFTQQKPLFQRFPFQLRDQEHRCDNIEYVDTSQQRDRHLEGIDAGNSTNDHRAKAPNSTPNVEQYVLRGRTGIGWIRLGHDSAIPPHHTVNEHTEQCPRPKHRHGIGQLRVGQHHNHGANLEQQKGGFSANAIRQLPKHPDTGNHAQNGHRGPHRRFGQVEPQRFR